LDDAGLPPIVSVAGRAKVGKTTFLVKLIAELTRRGYRIGVIKHSAHDLTLSEPGRDTWRHAQAGAQVVAFASKSELAIAHQLERELDLDEIVPHLGPVDLILTEGYKQAHKPKRNRPYLSQVRDHRRGQRLRGRDRGASVRSQRRRRRSRSHRATLLPSGIAIEMR
jgi:tetraacyldisaccharide-1-P 4'-kinase